MRNYVSEGKHVTLTAPTGGVTSGVPVLIGTLLVVPIASADQTEKFSGLSCGIITGDKATGQAWTEGAKLYWDVSASKFTTTATDNTFHGCAVEAAASGDTSGVIRLNGVSV